MLDFVKNKKVNYDEICMLNIETVNGFKGRVIQDVITKPSRKQAFIQGSNGRIEWFCHYKNNNDKISLYIDGNQEEIFNFSKSRPDDFVTELKHIRSCVIIKKVLNIINRGFETMKILKIYTLGHRLPIFLKKNIVFDKYIKYKIIELQLLLSYICLISVIYLF